MEAIMGGGGGLGGGGRAVAELDQTASRVPPSDEQLPAVNVSNDQLSAINTRLNSGQLTPTDLQQLEEIMLRAEGAIRALRASIIE
jgi:hypothetical protein